MGPEEEEEEASANSSTPCQGKEFQDTQGLTAQGPAPLALRERTLGLKTKKTLSSQGMRLPLETSVSSFEKWVQRTLLSWLFHFVGT